MFKNAHMSTVYHVHLSNTCIFCMLYYVSVGIIYVPVLSESVTFWPLRKIKQVKEVFSQMIFYISSVKYLKTTRADIIWINHTNCCFTCAITCEIWTPHMYLLCAFFPLTRTVYYWCKLQYFLWAILVWSHIICNDVNLFHCCLPHYHKNTKSEENLATIASL